MTWVDSFCKTIENPQYQATKTIQVGGLLLYTFLDIASIVVLVRSMCKAPAFFVSRHQSNVDEDLALPA